MAPCGVRGVPAHFSPLAAAGAKDKKELEEIQKNIDLQRL